MCNVAGLGHFMHLCIAAISDGLGDQRSLRHSNSDPSSVKKRRHPWIPSPKHKQGRDLNPAQLGRSPPANTDIWTAFLSVGWVF